MGETAGFFKIHNDNRGSRIVEAGGISSGHGTVFFDKAGLEFPEHIDRQPVTDIFIGIESGHVPLVVFKLYGQKFILKFAVFDYLRRTPVALKSKNILLFLTVMEGLIFAPSCVPMAKVVTSLIVARIAYMPVMETCKCL